VPLMESGKRGIPEVRNGSVTCANYRAVGRFE
jgi:hypothetical protein